MPDHFTRRDLMATAAALALAGPAFADSEPVFDDSKPTKNVAIPAAKTAEVDSAPLIKKTVQKLWNDSSVGMTEPNAMQFTPTGTLLLLDQRDPNKVFEVVADSGKILRSVQTQCIHGSGITMDGDGNWILTSTKAPAGASAPSTMIINPKDGSTIRMTVTPGYGYYGAVKESSGKPSGGHDVKWVGNGRYWMTVPASGRIFLMDEKTGKPVRSIPAPVLRTHGLVVDGDYIWSVASDFWQIHKISLKDGKVVGKIQMAKSDPTVHGLEMKDGQLWYCDADKGWICKLT